MTKLGLAARVVALVTAASVLSACVLTGTTPNLFWGSAPPKATAAPPAKAAPAKAVTKTVEKKAKKGKVAKAEKAAPAVVTKSKKKRWWHCDRTKNHKIVRWCNAKKAKAAKAAPKKEATFDPAKIDAPVPSLAAPESKPVKFKKKHIWSCDPTVKHQFFRWCDGPDPSVKGPR